MRKFNRIPIDSPDCLKKTDEHSGETKQKICTEKWKKRVAKFREGQIKNSPDFNWYGLDRELRPLLVGISQSHCAFCDCVFSHDDTEHCPIEHFYPKKKEPDKAFDWDNLFPICTICNTSKGAKFDTKLLKPDAPDYEFGDYFVFNYKTGEMEPNPSATPDQQKRAAKTIEIYNLKRKGLCRDRIEELKFYEGNIGTEANIDSYGHRDYIERGIPNCAQR